MNVKDHEIAPLLLKYKKICVIGLSRDPQKPAQKVPQYARSKGWEIVGVHPYEKEIAGFPCFASLNEVPAEFRKFVDVFRPSQEIPKVVEEVLKVGGVEVLFLQMGIEHAEAEKKAEAAGLKVVSDRCLHIEISKMESKT